MTEKKIVPAPVVVMKLKHPFNEHFLRGTIDQKLNEIGDPYQMDESSFSEMGPNASVVRVRTRTPEKLTGILAAVACDSGRDILSLKIEDGFDHQLAGEMGADSVMGIQIDA